MNIDWENLGKRMIALHQIGIRIEQDSGHRWIIQDENADFLPDCLAEDKIRSKCYGSYMSALDLIDQVLKENGKASLLEIFDGINHYDNLGVIFGDGTQ